MSILRSKRLTLREVARRCGVHPTTTARWIAQGVRGRTLPAFLIGGRRYVLEEDLEAFLRTGALDPSPKTAHQRQCAETAARLLDGYGVKQR